MNLELYTIPLSPFTQAVQLQLEMKGVEFTPTVPTREFVREGGLGEMNPLRKIPVMTVDGVVVPEAQVISELIEDLYPEPSLLPGDPLMRAKARLLARIADVNVATPAVLLQNNAFGAASKDVEAYAVDLINRGFAALDLWLGSGPYAAGEVRTIADCALPTAFFSLADMLPALGLKGLPSLSDKAATYLEAAKDDSDIARCLDRMDSALRERLAQSA